MPDLTPAESQPISCTKSNKSNHYTKDSSPLVPPQFTVCSPAAPRQTTSSEPYRTISCKIKIRIPYAWSAESANQIICHGGMRAGTPATIVIQCITPEKRLTTPEFIALCARKSTRVPYAPRLEEHGIRCESRRNIADHRPTLEHLAYHRAPKVISEFVTYRS